ncbi:MAG: LytR C-terminal domain-containing protein [Patescibacteria group bacterium]
MIIKPSNPFRAFLKTLKPRDVIYPSILVLFLGVVIILFFFGTQSISKNINKVFYSEENTAVQALDLKRYTLVAKKLNITVNIPKDGEQAVTKIEPVVQTASSTLALAKKSITIIVKNSTKKSGAATTLAKLLEDAGFQKPKTGNEPKLYATTTVFIKESRKDYEASLLEVVRKAYPDAVSTTSKETTATDVTIIIGTK